MATEPDKFKMIGTTQRSMPYGERYELAVASSDIVMNASVAVDKNHADILHAAAIRRAADHAKVKLPETISSRDGLAQDFVDRFVGGDEAVSPATFSLASAFLCEGLADLHRFAADVDRIIDSAIGIFAPDLIEGGDRCHRARFIRGSNQLAQILAEMIEGVAVAAAAYRGMTHEERWAAVNENH